MPALAEKLREYYRRSEPPEREAYLETLREVLETLLALSPKKIEVREDPSKLRKTDIPFLAGDGSKLRRETGWEPSIPFSRTLHDLLDFWREKAARSTGDRT